MAERARGLAARDRAQAKAGAGLLGPPPRLSAFAAAGVRVRAECEACRHKVDAAADVWAARLGDIDMAAMERRLVCGACGERDLIDARPLYGGPGQVAVHAAAPARTVSPAAPPSSMISERAA